ncbi:MAG: DUF1365 domain-containing protein [Alphaproteobacteria bacterium]
MPRQGLYLGRVMHHRLRPFRHRFRHRVFTVLLDLDRLAETAAASRLFGHNRWRPLSFHDVDHGPRDGSPLRRWVDRLLTEAGIAPAGLRVFVLCYPRLFGYVFNPITLYLCYDGERLAAVLYEVKNTFGDQHCYVLPVTGNSDGLVEQACAKRFHVSPFIAPEGAYRFSLRGPDERLSLVIRLDDDEGMRLIAATSGRFRAWSDAALLRAWASHPLMTVKVIAAIHWQALRLWLKGAPFFRRPDGTVPEASFGTRPST